MSCVADVRVSKNLANFNMRSDLLILEADVKAPSCATAVAVEHASLAYVCFLWWEVWVCRRSATITHPMLVLFMLKPLQNYFPKTIYVSAQHISMAQGYAVGGMCLQTSTPNCPAIPVQICHAHTNSVRRFL